MTHSRISNFPLNLICGFCTEVDFVQDRSTTGGVDGWIIVRAKLVPECRNVIFDTHVIVVSVRVISESWFNSRWSCDGVQSVLSLTSLFSREPSVFLCVAHHYTLY